MLFVWLINFQCQDWTSECSWSLCCHQEKDAKASLQAQIQSLREDNQRLLEESYSASAKLKKFTEWVFNTIDMNWCTQPPTAPLWETDHYKKNWSETRSISTALTTELLSKKKKNSQHELFLFGFYKRVPTRTELSSSLSPVDLCYNHHERHSFWKRTKE